MDWLNLPPLAALRTFAAFAEKRNVVEAGMALNVSHAAISQQLRALEKHLGIALLDRSGKALTLTSHTTTVSLIIKPVVNSGPSRKGAKKSSSMQRTYARITYTIRTYKLGLYMLLV